jgi:uncharacterized delta-60 repeat protein
MGQTGYPVQAFGDQGMTVMPMIEPFLENPMSTLVEYPDGRILTVGGINQTGPPDIYMARLMPNGALDPSFGTEGVRLHSIGALRDYVNDMLLLEDGRFILAGSADDTALVSCYFANGDPDLSFGTNGLVWLGLPETPSHAISMRRAQDGRITILLISQTSIHLARILPNGQLDASFSTDGLQLLHEVGEVYAHAQMDIDALGRAIVAWDGPDGTYTHVVVERWLANGDPDPTFGNGGQTVVDLTQYSDETWDVHTLPNGHVLISGETYTVNEEGGFVAELDETGALVPAFGVDGLFLFPPMGEYIDPLLPRTLVQPNGSIILGGVISEAGVGTMATARLLSNGQFDPAYGNNGIAVIGIADSEFDWISDMTLSASGSLLACGARAINGFARGVVVRISTGLEVGITENGGLASDFRLFPNPVVQNVSIEFSLSQGGPITATWMSIDGRVLGTVLSHGSTGTNTMNIEAPACLVNGLYVLRLGTPDGIRNKRFVVDRKVKDQ